MLLAEAPIQKLRDGLMSTGLVTDVRFLLCQNERTEAQLGFYEEVNLKVSTLLFGLARLGDLLFI